ncbi:hypothetical protein A3860_23140 [Niastella vici]|uniref:Aminoglycoside phosphotransferase domain-containing protein n=1 Tax=Niastella vici TaxID=1703345 RepID=A0A1V9G016_9BACT|nr:hypothetical protein [Niastella vici]OQP63836.1 hypothetical protein A3860_23140 [Niastella vici]
MAKIFIEQPLKETRISAGEKVAFLKQPGAYPFEVSQVEAKETHMSWVFLADGFAYKLKKPVKYRFLDFSILEARFRDCRDEVRLNRRLAKNIYLGIIPLTVDEKGTMTLEGKGTIIDWLVKMKRLPEENMLDYVIRHHIVNKTMVQPAAILLTEFYKGAQSADTKPGLYREKLKGEVHAVYRELVNPMFQLPIAMIELLTAGLLHFLNDHASMFDKRVTDGKIIEAHGDLRPEHICIAQEPAIIDCLEFNRDLRILDTAEELSFLAMECDILGNFLVGDLFLDTYASFTSDHIPSSLILFYKIKRACLRTFLVIRHILEPMYKEDPKWLAKANGYLQLAAQYHKKLIA